MGTMSMEPYAQRFGHAANFTGDGNEGSPFGWIFSAMFNHHTNSAFADFGGGGSLN